MKFCFYILLIFFITFISSCAEDDVDLHEQPQEQVEQDTLVSAFFGLDNALPSLLCNQPGSLLDGMPVNFRFPMESYPDTKLILKFPKNKKYGNINIPRMSGCFSPS